MNELMPPARSLPALLWRELAERGFVGRPALVRAWATKQRRRDPGAARASMGANGRPWRPPSGRGSTRMLMADTATLPLPEPAFVAHLLEEAPKLAAPVEVTKRLALLLRRRGWESLDTVLIAAEATPLAGFIAELRKDLPAVQATLETRWTTSPAEGRISRFKIIKRTIYGCARFDLLRARVLRVA
jgi:transposase